MLPAKPFYLIRHGQSEANAAQKLAGGKIDTPLTKKGIQQAKNVAAYIDQLKIKPVKIFHSPLSRAYDTAIILNETLQLPLQKSDDLREQELGDWEQGKSADYLNLWFSGVNPPQGETHERFNNRVKEAVTSALNAPTNAPIMIVAHGGIFRALGALYKQENLDSANCHLHYFEPAPEESIFPWRVWRFDVKNNTPIKHPADFGN